MPNPLPKTRFTILAAPRTGSNFLCTLLNSHPDILCHHEIFNPKEVFYALPLRNTSFHLATVAERDQHPLEFLSRVWEQSRGNACVGFKMTHRQNLIVFNTILADPHIEKIVLKRKNRIKTHVSKLIAEHRGIWEYYGEFTLPKHPTRICIDLDRLHQDIEFNNNYYAEIETRLHQTHQASCVVTYEDLDQKNTQERILSFLGLPYQQLHGSSRKQNPDDLRLIVENFDRLTQQLQGTELLKELQDDNAFDLS